MITTQGKGHIKRYLAQYVPAIAGAMCFGIGARTEAGSDVNLQFESTRSPISLITYDFVNNKIIYKAPIPDDYSGSVYEIGLYSQYQDNVAGVFASKMITTFSSTDEVWVDATTAAAETYTSANARIGGDSLSHVPSLSATKTSALRGLSFDLSGYSNADFITVALNVGNTNTSSISVIFMTDISNYYTLTVTTPVQSAGYKILDLLKTNAVPTGTPDWGTISEIRVQTTSKVTGTSAIDWDGIRMQDNDTNNIDYILVARKVLSTPAIKIVGQPQDIEYTLDVSV